MKNTFKLIALFAVIICFVSCNDDDSGDSPNNPETGADFTYSQGFIINYGTSNESGINHEGFNLDLVLYSSEVTLDPETEELSGTGDGVYFEMFSSQDDGYASGNYTFSTTEPFPEGSFDYGELCNGCDFGEEEPSGLSEITGGTVNIERSGNSYDISFTVTDESGETFTGVFDGSLIVIDENESATSKGYSPIFKKNNK